MIKIRLQPGQDLWFTSDTHYNQVNMVKALTNWDNPDDNCRDFKTLSAMNDFIVHTINKNAKQDDIIIHCGDWSFGGVDSVFEFRNRIICKNIYLFLGNHDDHIQDNINNCQSLFTKVSSYDMVEVIKPNGKNEKSDRNKYFVGHYPLASWREMRRGIPNIFGHIHFPPELKILKYKSMDCGLDGNDLEIYHYTEINKLMDKQEIGSLLTFDRHVINDR